MPISNQSNRREYAGNGVATEFDFDDPVQSENHIGVYLIEDATGAAVAKTLNIDYTVTGVADADGCTIVFMVPPETGYTVLIRAAVPPTQSTRFSNLGRYDPETHTAALDMVVQQIQSLWERVLRTLRFPVYVDEIQEASTLTGYLSKYLFMNSSGSIIGVEGTPSQPITHYSYFVEPGTGDTYITVPDSYTPGSFNLSVYYNGAKLVLGDEYEETDSTHITLATPATSGDVIEFAIGEVFDVTLPRTAKQEENFTGITSPVLTLTAFTYTPGNREIEVYLNGSRLYGAADAPEYTETNSSTVTLGFTPIASDRISVVAGRVVDPLTASSIPDGGITTAKLQTGAVTTDKIADGAVTAGKLASSLDLSGKTIQYPASSISEGHLAAALDLSGKTLTLPAASVTNAQLDLAPNDSEIKTAINATGAMPIYACRAWGSFNGVLGIAAYQTANIYNIVRNSLGDYTVYFATPMTDANYVVIVSGNSAAANNDGRSIMVKDKAAGYFSIHCTLSADGVTESDLYYCDFAVFR